MDGIARREHAVSRLTLHTMGVEPQQADASTTREHGLLDARLLVPALLFLKEGRFSAEAYRILCRHSRHTTGAAVSRPISARAYR